MPEPGWRYKGAYVGCCCRQLGAESPERELLTAELLMDWDELVPPKAQSGVAVGDNLSTLSVAELEARIAAFEAEIERVKAELEAKRRHEEAASALFKR